ncbi:unnamed protein product [Cunninghamella blakesleeana]
MLLFNIYISLIILYLCLLTKAENILSVYHKRGSDYLKRGEITGIPHSPKYIPLENGEGTITSDLYQVKIKNNATGQIVLQSVPFKWISRLFYTSFNDKQNVYHVDYYTEGENCEPVVNTLQTNAFNSKVEIAKVVEGARPVLGQFGANKNVKSKPKSQNINKEADANEEELEEQTFVQKYWYLLLAGGFMLLTNIIAPPPEQGQQGQQRS